tara:strand:- start:127 stop:375 length:249 start_codon:yes stop_codon:yes gene_type:complete
MVTVWFLLALVSYPNMPAIAYKGFGGFNTYDECESKRIIAEDSIAIFELNRGQTAYIETFCLEMEVFESQLKKNFKGAGLGA